MKKITTLMLMFLAMMFAPVYAEQVEDYSSTINLFKSADQVKAYFKNAYGYAVFPTVGKGGLVFGGSHGKGQVYRGGKVTGFTSLTQITVGFQAGGQAVSQIIFLEDKRAYDEFTSGNFAFDAQASAVAITAGAQAKASTEGGGTASASTGSPGKYETNYRKGMAVFIHTKGGLMYEASVGGQKFNFKPVK